MLFLFSNTTAFVYTWVMGLRIGLRSSCVSKSAFGFKQKSSPSEQLQKKLTGRLLESSLYNAVGVAVVGFTNCV